MALRHSHARPGGRFDVGKGFDAFAHDRWFDGANIWLIGYSQARVQSRTLPARLRRGESAKCFAEHGDGPFS